MERRDVSSSGKGSLFLALALVGAIAAAPATAAAQAEPKGPHPRLLLDDALRATWKKQAGQKGSAVARSIAACDQIRADPKESARDYYMGLTWAGHLGSCLVAWAATGKDEHARTAMIYFQAMLDDLQTVGDGKGGDEAARRDAGFAIRAMGPYTALAYDWLHDYAGMTEPMRQKARQRFKAWTDWYLQKGYRARDPGTNYQAGYLVAATFIAIAQGGEAGAEGGRFWKHVADTLWHKDMARVLAKGAILDGGDWAEGWQYGPLSVAEYAVAARAMRSAGVEVPGVGRWLQSLLTRFVHSLTPGGKMFVVGDTDHEQPYLDPNLLVLAAVVLGDAPEAAQRQALGEAKRLGLTSKDFLFFQALMEGRGLKPEQVPRDRWPTSYRALGIGTLYARSDWSDRAVWTAVQCSRQVEADHTHPNAGNFVLSRGTDDAIVDPSPYGTLSSLTSNAPTVESAQLPPDYKPSQAYWSEKTRFVWGHQTGSGLVVARCDYADQYKFQDRPSDVPEAVRDLVVWPHGGDATAVVLDRARSGDPKRGLHLRFRSPSTLTLDGDVARGKVGGSAVTIRRVASSSGKPEVKQYQRSDCFKGDVTRGNCDTARFASGAYRLVVPGPTMTAWHVIDAAAAGGGDPAVEPLNAKGLEGVKLVRGGSALVVAWNRGGKDLSVPAPPGATVVVLDAPADGDTTGASARKGSGGCDVAVKATGGDVRTSATPAVLHLDADCKLVEDHAAPAAAAAALTPAGGAAEAAEPDYAPAAPGAARASDEPRSPRAGCCGAQSTPSPPVAAALLVVGLLAIRLRRR